MDRSYSELPAGLPAPTDDGACDHLVGMALPALFLPSTQGGRLDVSRLPGSRCVLFFYPMTGQPGLALPDGWDAVPGARGCTPQNCAIRDHHAEFRDLGVSVYAVSTQTTAYQREMVDRLHLPYAVLSDADFALVDALRLPTFEAGGMRLVRRISMVACAGIIEHVVYPVFPPDRSAEPVLQWLRR